MVGSLLLKISNLCRLLLDGRQFYFPTKFDCMLSTARRVAVRHHNPCIWRTYVTEENHDSEQSFSLRRRGLRLDDGTKGRARIPRPSMARKTIYIRAWEHPASMAEAFAIVRGIEWRYGRIRDFRWTRVYLRIRLNNVHLHC